MCFPVINHRVLYRKYFGSRLRIGWAPCCRVGEPGLALAHLVYPAAQTWHSRCSTASWSAAE